MKGVAHLSPFAALSFPGSKKATCLLQGLLRDFSIRQMEEPVRSLTGFRLLSVSHDRAPQTT